jgi:DNA invertase Pin-like site-specific DNA recombinase
MKRAFGYLRVSGKGQIEGDGFTRQHEAIKTYAKAHDIRIVKVFREEGVSGTKESADRPAWTDLMAALHADGVRTVLIEKLDRLARDLMVQETIIADLRKHGFDLLSVAEPDLMANDPTRILVRQMMGAVAQYEKSQIVAKLRGARQRKRAKEGRCEGAKPYGTLPGEAETLDRIQRMRSVGQTFQAIANALNTAGVAPRRSEQWHPFAIARILQREQAA